MFESHYKFSDYEDYEKDVNEKGKFQNDMQ